LKALNIINAQQTMLFLFFILTFKGLVNILKWFMVVWKYCF